MNIINFTLNNKPVQVPAGTTILDAAAKNGCTIPTLCHMDMHNINVNKSGSCRICVVEAEGRRNLLPACSTAVTNGMVIHTNSPRAVTARRTVLELLLSNHPSDCLVCERNLHCELQRLAAELGVRNIKYQGKRSDYSKDTSSASLIRDPNKCILCRRCETMCNDIQTVGVYSAIHRGFNTIIGTEFNRPINETTCTFCGQCVSVCPTGALTQTNHTAEIRQAINDPDKYVVVQTAPAIRVALGEMFGYKIGTSVTGKMVSALRLMGFDKVFDTDFAADLTVMEESKEIINRLKTGKRLPILTSCCPAWVNFIEMQFPDLLNIPSTCKSPHEMFGAVTKTYLADKYSIDPAKMTVVSVMPCLAKKYEAVRPELVSNAGERTVDYVITTRELAAMIKESGINFSELPDENFDPVMGESTGAAVLFGVSGGVLEAALRTVSYMLTGSSPHPIEFNDLRGSAGIKETEVKINDITLSAAVVHGLGNARTVLEKIREGTTNYHIIEIMACPGGCVGGGGQPYYFSRNDDVLRKRTEAVYSEDRKYLRFSYENTQVRILYDEFLGEPGSETAHKLLHTNYHPR